MRQIQMKTTIVPQATTVAGSSLTSDNWQESGVQAISCDLESLIMRPGMAYLLQLDSLRAYVPWQQTLVLNALLSGKCQQGMYLLRCPIDGHKQSFSLEELLNLISHLAPDVVIFPNALTPRMVCRYYTEVNHPQPVSFFSKEALEASGEHTGAGVYLRWETSQSEVDWLTEVAAYEPMPRYVFGEFDVPMIQKLIEMGVCYIASDTPAADAMKGYLYTKSGGIALDNPGYADEFMPIDADCSCSTCQQQFTRAYLHHLLSQTPLLCQRLLLQHNLYFVTSLLKLK